MGVTLIAERGFYKYMNVEIANTKYQYNGFNEKW